MFNKGYYSLLFGIFMVLFVSQTIHAQSKWFFTPGLFYNGGCVSRNVNAGGILVGLEYKPTRLFSIELRTKHVNYNFNDGTAWLRDEQGDKVIPPVNSKEARIKYDFYSPQIGLTPKLHLRLKERLSIFVENEVVAGLMTGKIKYREFREKEKYTESIFCYNVGIGIEYDLEGIEYRYKGTLLCATIGYSTLNYHDKIIEHQPIGYRYRVPYQNAPVYFNVQLKIPLTK